jgi:hypothetical protein
MHITYLYCPEAEISLVNEELIKYRGIITF